MKKLVLILYEEANKKMAIAVSPLTKRRMTVSINPSLYCQVFKETTIPKSQIVEKALEEYLRRKLKKQVIAFCSARDESDISDAELSLPAQMEVLDYD